MTDQPWTGGCLCGAVRYRSAEPPFSASYCHCGMCRKVSGAPFAAFMRFPDGAVVWEGAAAQRYVSSPGISRRFCPTCGSSLTFEAEGMTFIMLGSLDAPERVEVQRHCYTRFRLPGLRDADRLPEFEGPEGSAGGLPV